MRMKTQEGAISAEVPDHADPWGAWEWKLHLRVCSVGRQRSWLSVLPQRVCS